MGEQNFRFEDWLDRKWACECGRQHRIAVKRIELGEGAVEELPEYCRLAGYANVALIGDSRTFAAAGGFLHKMERDPSLQVRRIVIEDRDGELAADGDAVLQVLVQMVDRVQAMVAVGSGTLHDIVRFASSKLGIPFLSVPTAASVDGFSSAGAPLIVHGFKQTIQTHSPEAIFADPVLLASAPQRMNAAGFGDMLGKFTSLADWKMGALLLDEFYCPLAAEWTRKGLETAIRHLPGIAAGEPAGLQALMEGLLLSGMAMLAIDSSRPASGAEHHLSHYWEMNFLQEGRPAVLHGAKVGTATALMAGLYARIAVLTEQEAASRIHQMRNADRDILEDEILAAYGKLAPAVIREFFAKDCAEWSAPEEFHRKILEKWADIRKLSAEVPQSEQVRAWLQQAGGPQVPQEIGVSEPLIAQALDSARFLRNRYTVLRLAHEMLR